MELADPARRKVPPSSIRRRRGPNPGAVVGGDLEDGADAQEEASEDGPQLRDQVELHHLTQVGVVAGGVGLELEETG